MEVGVNFKERVGATVNQARLEVNQCQGLVIQGSLESNESKVQDSKKLEEVVISRKKESEDDSMKMEKFGSNKWEEKVNSKRLERKNLKSLRFENESVTSKNGSMSESGSSKVNFKENVGATRKMAQLRSRNGSLCSCGNLFNIREDIMLNLVDMFEHVHASGQPNYISCRVPLINSNLNIEKWRERLLGYDDVVVCDYLEFGFPLDFRKGSKLSYDERRNHKGARDYPGFINGYLDRECGAGRIAGPFCSNPLSTSLVLSPMNTVPKSSLDERRVIVDLSWPAGCSVNDGISKDMYLGQIIDLHYASVEQVCKMVIQVGVGAHIYKRDLRHAYRQIPVDPGDFKYLGYFWNEMMYFDTVLAMGQRNAAMACSRTTKAIIYVHELAGYMGTSYLDDLIGVSSPQVSDAAYSHLGETLLELGLFENKEKACPPATTQIVLGIEINTIEGTMAVPAEKLEEIIALVAFWQRKRRTTKVQLQSLIGKLQFVSKCVLQSRVFLNRLLESLRAISKKRSIKLSDSFKKDIKWWSMFVVDYNGVSFIPAVAWAEPDITFATDSCLKGCGGMCFKEYFHTSFPKFIMDQSLRIHHLEMLAVLVGVRIWGKYCVGMKVQIFCDNEAVVTVINSSKTRDPFLATCIRELWLEVARNAFELRAIHLPGEENRVPDWLSRWDLENVYRERFYRFIGDESDQYTEIKISPEMFKFSGNL